MTPGEDLCPSCQSAGQTLAMAACPAACWQRCADSPSTDLYVVVLHHTAVGRQPLRVCVVIPDLCDVRLCLPAVTPQLVQLGFLQLQLLQQLRDVSLLRLTASGACRA